MKSQNYLILLTLGFLLAFKSEELPGFKKIDQESLKDYNDGYKRWSNKNNEHIIYYQKQKGSKLVDEAYIFRTGDIYYRLNSKILGMRVWSDTVYYFNSKKDHTNAGWFTKFGGGMVASDPPKNLDEKEVEKYYKKILKYENGKIIEWKNISEIKSVWDLPDGFIYISQPGLGVVKSEYAEQMIKRIKKST